MSRQEQVGVAGLDVSAKELVVAREGKHGPAIRRFGNASSGHQALIRWLREHGIGRVVLEASGIYSLDVALAIHAEADLEVMVANPRAVHAFAMALKTRHKTDPVDAGVMLVFGQRMPFEPWQPPPQSLLELRTVMRRMRSLTRALTREKNQFHAASKTRTTPQVVLDDMADAIRHLERRVARLEDEALALVRSDDSLRRQLELLCSVPGIAERSACQIIAELGVLPKDMTAKQWVAHAGLDPRKVQSGTSIDRPSRISRRGNRYMRAALYMPTLSAVRHDPGARAHYQALLLAGKSPMQANVAVMRKLLHGIYGMFRHGASYRPDKLFSRTPVLSAHPAGDTSVPTSLRLSPA